MEKPNHLSEAFPSIAYQYHNLPVPGGGYVTGFAYHPKDPDVLYCRTDIGGVYRYDRPSATWISLIDHVTMEDLSETYPAAIALDPSDSSILYVACGYSDWRTARKGVMAVSHDYGHTFLHYEMPCVVHGNFPGRGAGPRLAVDPLNPSILYFAGQRGGLYRSKDCGKHWEAVSLEDGARANEPCDTFLLLLPSDKDSDHTSHILLGTTGAGNLTREGRRIALDESAKPWEKDASFEIGDGSLRGHSIYLSSDAGASWQELSMPASPLYPDCKISGLMGFRATHDDSYLYITCHATGPKARQILEGYSCDCVGLCDGRILRYPLHADGSLGDWEDITPVGGPLHFKETNSDNVPGHSGYDIGLRLPCGFGGISTCPGRPGLLIAATLLERRGDIIFRSYDYGNTWEAILFGTSVGRLDFHTSYMKPEHNGGRSLIHWMSDLQINPHNPNEALFTTGTGVFACFGLNEEVTVWEDHCRGLEETVHLGISSPHAGEVLALDMIGDLGGFAFTSLDQECEDSFNDGKGNRYITCINADYSDLDPQTLIVTARGNWTGSTTGGLILSHNQGKTFRHLELPMGLSDLTDELLDQIARPNRNAGWVALSPDTRHIVWSIARGIDLPIPAVVYSEDGGETFALSRFHGRDGKPVTEGTVKVMADRVHDDTFYGFESTRKIYVSRDYGANFHQLDVPEEIPDFRLSLIDTADPSSLCPLHGKGGIFYLSMLEYGLYKLAYDYATGRMTFTRLSKASDVFYKIGLGIGKDRRILGPIPALYAAASLNGVYGFYRSDDEGSTWCRINTADQMYGQIIALCGDSRTYGRFYLATGSRGLLYGEPADCT